MLVSLKGQRVNDIDDYPQYLSPALSHYYLCIK